MHTRNNYLIKNGLPSKKTSNFFCHESEVEVILKGWKFFWRKFWSMFCQKVDAFWWKQVSVLTRGNGLAYRNESRHLNGRVSIWFFVAWGSNLILPLHCSCQELCCSSCQRRRRRCRCRHRRRCCCCCCRCRCCCWHWRCCWCFIASRCCCPYQGFCCAC